MSEIDLSADRARALALTPVSRETEKRLDAYVALLLLWQNKFNLISASTIPQIWTRHIADSLQLIDLVPDARTWLDFGSGAGFPGIPIACVLAEREGSLIHLVESNGKKAGFLREAVQVTGIPAVVHQIRIEDYGDRNREPVDVVSARAVSPLKLLCEQAFPLLKQGSIGLFPKGRDVASELTEATKYWKIQYDQVTSRTSAESSILLIRHLARR